MKFLFVATVRSHIGQFHMPLIRALKAAGCDCRVMVGGAVVTQVFADQIGADFYGKDAMQSVYYAQKVFAVESNM